MRAWRRGCAALWVRLRSGSALSTIRRDRPGSPPLHFCAEQDAGHRARHPSRLGTSERRSLQVLEEGRKPLECQRAVVQRRDLEMQSDQRCTLGEGGWRRIAASCFSAPSVSILLWLLLETGSWGKQTSELSQADSIITQGSAELTNAKPGLILNCLK